MAAMDATAPAILEIGGLLLAAAAAGWFARRIGLPAVVGFLGLGAAVSPFTPGFVANRDQLQFFADLGVVILLFEVGIEVDLGRLRREQRALAIAAPLQAILTTVAAGAVLVVLGVPAPAAALLGLAIALSSSVVIVNMTRSSRRTMDRRTGETLLGWSVLQDVTGLVLAAGILAVLDSAARPFEAALLGLAAFAVVAAGAAAFLPRVLAAIRSQGDVFLIVSVAIGLCLAGIGSMVFGVPLALAAFVGGLVVTESTEAAEVRRQLLPFRDLFAFLFFVAVGTLIDPAAFPAALPWVGLFLVLLVVGRGAVAYVLARVASLDARHGQLAVGLSQVGEFSFVLGAAAAALGAISPIQYVALVTTVVLSIAGSSIAVRLVGSPRPVRVTEG
jgi:CPA2 family monovalent cation:H+ antiporter-2